jgi:hypothetical protein
VNDFLRTEFAHGSSDAIEVHPPPPCCERVRRGELTGWCHLDDGHDGDHAGVLSVPPAANTYEPRGKR